VAGWICSFLRLRTSLVTKRLSRAMAGGIRRQVRPTRQEASDAAFGFNSMLRSSHIVWFHRAGQSVFPKTAPIFLIWRICGGSRDHVCTFHFKRCNYFPPHNALWLVQDRNPIGFGPNSIIVTLQLVLLSPLSLEELVTLDWRLLLQAQTL